MTTFFETNNNNKPKTLSSILKFTHKKWHIIKLEKNKENQLQTEAPNRHKRKHSFLRRLVMQKSLHAFFQCILHNCMSYHSLPTLVNSPLHVSQWNTHCRQNLNNDHIRLICTAIHKEVHLLVKEKANLKLKEKYAYMKITK